MLKFNIELVGNMVPRDRGKLYNLLYFTYNYESG